MSVYYRVLDWLRPGLGLKRWTVPMLFGALLMGFGLAPFVYELFPQFYGARVVQWGLVGLGIGILFWAVVGLVTSLVSRVGPQDTTVPRVLQRRGYQQRGPSIVAIGGGTGLSTILRGLKRWTSNLTAVVAVTDNGGSSGRLREEFNLPAPGDIRNCLTALAPEEERMSDLFAHRFSSGNGLEGHSVGNLLLTALTELHGSFPQALRECSDVLAIEGKVLPVMNDASELGARFEDGSRVLGEMEISRDGGVIDSLFLSPSDVEPNQEVIQAIRRADLVVVGPGSLYTSLLTNFLVPGIARACNGSEATLAYICNIMTQPGETDEFTVRDHLDAFRTKLPEPVIFDHLIVNTRPLQKHVRENYQESGARPVQFDFDQLRKDAPLIHAGDFVAPGVPVRHDAEAVAATLVRLANQHRGERNEQFQMSP